MAAAGRRVACLGVAGAARDDLAIGGVGHASAREARRHSLHALRAQEDLRARAEESGERLHFRLEGGATLL